MTPAELLAELIVSGYTVDLVGARLRIRPKLSSTLTDRVRLHRDDIVAYLRETMPPEPQHRYLLWRGAVNPDYSVCIGCGYPPALHGVEALANAVVVDDPTSVALIDATAAVGVAVAQNIAGSWEPRAGEAT